MIYIRFQSDKPKNSRLTKEVMSSVCSSLAVSCSVIDALTLFTEAYNDVKG